MLDESVKSIGSRSLSSHDELALTMKSTRLFAAAPL
jgi:hypothetical protein